MIVRLIVSQFLVAVVDLGTLLQDPESAKRVTLYRDAASWCPYCHKACGAWARWSSYTSIELRVAEAELGQPPYQLAGLAQILMDLDRTSLNSSTFERCERCYNFGLSQFMINA